MTETKQHGGARPNSGPKPSEDRCPCGCGLTRARGLKRHPARIATPDIEATIELLAAGVSKKARIPRGFALWSDQMKIMWLKQNQENR